MEVKRWRYHLWFSAKHHKLLLEEGEGFCFYLKDDGTKVNVTNAERVIDGEPPNGLGYPWPDKVYLGIGTYTGNYRGIEY